VRLEKAVEKAKGIVDFLAGNKMVHSQLASVGCAVVDWVVEG
jgi:hypothetical protein